MSRQATDSVRSLPLLAEVLLVGVLVCLASIPVVTVLGAVAAGCVLLRELVDRERTPRVREFVVLLCAALRDPIAWLAPLGLVAVGGLDLLALLAGLPGAGLLGPVLAVLLGAVTVTGLRAAASWRPGSRWRVTLAGSAVRAARDWPGSLLLAGAVLVCVLLALGLPVLLLVLPGLLAMAAVAVQRRSGS